MQIVIAMSRPRDMNHTICAPPKAQKCFGHGLAAIFCYIISVLRGHFVPFSSTLNQDQILAFVYALFTGELPNFKDELHSPKCAPPFRRLLFPISPSPSPEGCGGVWALTRATRLGKNASGFTSTHSSKTRPRKNAWYLRAVNCLSIV